MYSNPPLQRTILLTTPTSPLLPTIVRSRRAKRAEDSRSEGEGEETKQKDAVNPIYWWLVQVGSYNYGLDILIFWVILRKICKAKYSLKTTVSVQ